VRTLKVFVLVLCFLGTTSAWASVIYLKNGDKITGDVVVDDPDSILVDTLAAGVIKINKSFIDLPKTFPEKYGPPSATPQPQVVAVPAVEWKKDLSLGYTQTEGNTKAQSGQVSASLNRKTPGNETTLKFNALYSSSDGVMNGKKFYGMARYAYSFGNDLKWYNFYKLEGDQDYFADIEYRLTPSTGVGYWFSTTDDLKLLTELGIGYQYTEYRIETSPNGGEPVLVPRFFVDKRLIGNLHLSEDLTMYPSLDDFRDYRFHSETALVNPITQRWSLKISYTDDFNSDPPVGFKKNDSTWLTSLEYHY
jgi:putative salt-induced outer membrane protein